MRSASRSRKSQLPVDSITIEGGIIPVEWIIKVSQHSAPFQSEADYGVGRGHHLRGEINRFFQIAKIWWNKLAESHKTYSAEELPSELKRPQPPQKAGIRRRNIADHDTQASAMAAAEVFVISLLREVFGFSDISPTEPKNLATETKYRIGLEALGGMVPIVVAPAGIGLDTRSPLFVDDKSSLSPFRLLQLYLNSTIQENALWGIVSDCHNLRIVRKNTRHTTDAWIDANLKKIFSEDLYADFALLWLLCHSSRFGRIGQRPHECILESWRTRGCEEGRRAYNLMGRGVKEALKILGDGFLRHKCNDSLRDAIGSSKLSSVMYYNQLLRLVYRIIFLLTVEERKLLFSDNSRLEDHITYQEGYSAKRIREDSTIREAYEDYHDRWDAMKVVFAALSHGETRCSLPGLAGIFNRTACPDLDAAEIDNCALLNAMHQLAWLTNGDVCERINLRDNGPEELGSVYEGLLELVPQTMVTETGRLSFTFLNDKKGNARKTSGSYYTPECLVKLVLESALDPVIRETKERNPGNHANALLSLTIVDPACGSGHFLLSAARKLATQIAGIKARGIKTGTDTYTTEYRWAIRQVISRCIFGTDLNQMAVELCKVSLWLEAVVPGLPLTFLDSHIQWGNSLLGTTDKLMKNGIPDAAWEPLVGDDKKTAASLKKQNRNSARTHRCLGFLVKDDDVSPTLAKEVAVLDAEADDDISSLTDKQLKWERVLASQAYRQKKLAADLWCSAFVWPKQPGNLAKAAPITDLWSQVSNGELAAPKLTTATMEELVEQYRFFHWELQFPQVFSQGGFDVVVSNPPWERVKLDEREFFASRNENIANAPNAATRKKLIAMLPTNDPRLWHTWCSASRKAEGSSGFIRHSNRYPLCGRGDVNTYAVFAEHNRDILRPNGRTGFIVPQGIVTDDSTKAFFQSVTSNKNLVSFTGFNNREGIFPDVSRAYQFGACTLSASAQQKANADYVFYAQNATEAKETFRSFTLSPVDLAVLNPITLTCPTFRSCRDATINLSAYRRTGVLWQEKDDSLGNPWKIRFLAMFHMSNYSHEFRTRKELVDLCAILVGNRFVTERSLWLPLVEAKMLARFNHRHGSYEGLPTQKKQSAIVLVDDSSLSDPHRATLPNYWVPESLVTKRLSGHWDYEWMLGWRDVTSVSSARTFHACITPRTAAANNFPIMIPSTEPELVACLYACLCSYFFDYTTRQKVGGLHLNVFEVKQLPVLPPSHYLDSSPWQKNTLLRDWFLPRILELTYTAWDLQPFARDVGYNGPPFRWNRNRRFLLCCELDAAFFHLYSIPRDDVNYIMDTFSVIRKNDEATHGVFRTKRTILEIYDAMTRAERTGRSYATLLDPPPADASVAHRTRSEAVETQMAPILKEESLTSADPNPRKHKGRK